MAGIGFELRRTLEKDSLGSTLRAYFFAGIISGGPWLISVSGMLFLSMVSAGAGITGSMSSDFIVMATYMIAASLLLSSIVQFLFVRFAADMIFKGREGIIFPSLMGVILVLVICTMVPAAYFITRLDIPPLLALLMIMGIALMNGLWIIMAMASAIKAYVRVLVMMASAYSIMVGLVWLTPGASTGFILACFLLGHGLLMAALLFELVREYPPDCYLSLDFFFKRPVNRSLIINGSLFYLAFWIDRFLFWWYPGVSKAVVGGLQVSLVYDIPVFLASLSVIPAMAVFLVRLEADFAHHYERSIRAICSGGTLSLIRHHHHNMTKSVQLGMKEILVVQGMITLLVGFVAEELMAWLAFPINHQWLFRNILVGVSFQILLAGVINVLFYMDLRKRITQLLVLMLGCNVTLTWASLQLGPAYYGLGFSVAVAITLVVGLVMLNQALEGFLYRMYMVSTEVDSVRETVA